MDLIRRASRAIPFRLPLHRRLLAGIGAKMDSQDLANERQAQTLANAALLDFQTKLREAMALTELFDDQLEEWLDTTRDMLNSMKSWDQFLTEKYRE